ncbi:Glycine/D-amino acid oxidase [Roseovarius nanhaiticus]|uniref:Glycine/D-amino acid oxidase n=1 Tax=Roseovarius nanhaiticus TaxID=573024 RepID=A0A1N7G3V1_9RHOB|nr:FAD-binding oxidoreductase [Roseovarius nanhaiticus]SEK38082.1 Glycine/D-amino acid oxidase [Roseovarius nanhaiticus]SIS07228.1 Glycine/D-amino acid oxidase [Roseovarius nanhaiticus]
MTSYRATRRPVHQGPAAWNVILGPQPGPQTLEADRTADFIVIGAGFAGLSAARRLTQLQPGARIAVLEAGRVAEGAAGRNSGFMIDLPHDLQSEDYAGAGDDRRMIEVNRHAIRFAADAVEAYGIDKNYFDRAGKVNGAVSAAAEAHNRSYARHLETLGESCEMLDAQAMREMTGSGHYRSGLYSPGTVMLQPAGYIRGLAKGLRAGGVDIYEGAACTRIDRVGADWQVQTDHGRITAPRVILTVNGHLESFGIEKGRLLQLFLFAVMTPVLDADALGRLGGQPRWGITPSDPMGTTVRRIDSGQGGNRIVVRTCAALRPGMRAAPKDVTRAARVMQAKFDQRFPQLAGLRMEHAWAGHLCLSLNGVSVTRQLDEGVFSGCVQNGLGTARGTLAGIAAAEMAVGDASCATQYFAGESRPKRLPPQPFQQIGANALLRIKEWRAREE